METKFKVGVKVKCIGNGVYELQLELIETEGGNKMEFKVGDRVRFKGRNKGNCVPRIYNVSDGIDEELIIHGMTTWDGEDAEVVGISNGYVVVRYSNDGSNIMQLGFKAESLELAESSETLQTTQMEKTVFNVLVVNKKTSVVEKDETVVASNEKEAILRAYGVDVDNVAFNVTERSKFTEDKPQTVVVEDTKGK